MKLSLSTLLVTALSAGSALAAPAPEAAKSMMVANTQWTITNMKRVCNAADTKCTWTFGINNGAANTPCTLVVNGTPASQTNGGPKTCGAYTVTSGWSGQFGPNNGFTTLAVVNQGSRQIVWPAYTDVQLKGGKVVKPDQAYTPAALP